MCLQRIVSQRNQRSLATLKEQLQKLDVHLHQNIAMQHQVHMLVRDRREMRKAAQNGAPGAGKGPVAKNPTPTPTMLVKQVLQQSTGAIASSATQSVPVQKSATQRIDDTPNELVSIWLYFTYQTWNSSTNVRRPVTSSCLLRIPSKSTWASKTTKLSKPDVQWHRASFLKQAVNTRLSSLES